MINEHGGNMLDAIGVPEDMLRKAASMAVCKINIDSDLRLAMTGTIRKYFDEHPSHFDPRQYLKPARAAIKRWFAIRSLTFSAATARHNKNIFRQQSRGYGCDARTVLTTYDICSGSALCRLNGFHVLLAAYCCVL